MAVAMTDKLFALREESKSGDASDDRPAELTIRIGSSGATVERVDGISNVLITVDELTRAINQIGQYVEKIRFNHAALLAAFQNQDARDENDQLMGDIRKLSYKVHNELKRMKQEIESGRGGTNRKDVGIRIQQSQYIGLSRRFRDIMGEYSQVQEDYRDKSKDRIQRQLKSTGKQVTEEQLEEMLDSDDPQLFTRDSLGSMQEQQALGEVMARHQELLRLEENVKELHDMLYDIALLVEEQGELIDLVEHNVEGGRVSIPKMQATTKATASYKNTFMNRCVIWCVLCGIFMIVLLIMAIAGGLAAYFLLNS